MESILFCLNKHDITGVEWVYWMKLIDNV